DAEGAGRVRIGGAERELDVQVVAPEGSEPPGPGDPHLPGIGLVVEEDPGRPYARVGLVGRCDDRPAACGGCGGDVQGGRGPSLQRPFEGIATRGLGRRPAGSEEDAKSHAPRPHGSILRPWTRLLGTASL